MIRLFGLMLIMCFVSTLAGQTMLDFNKLTIDDGFTSSRANVITQDQHGYIWIGTWNGLNRYDGYKTETFKPKYHDTTTLSNREVLAIIESSTGEIWIGTTFGLNCYNPETRHMKRYPVQKRILSLLEDSDNKIWIGTNGGGLYRLDPQTDELSHFLGSELVSDIYEDSRNIFWVATYSGLIILDRNNNSYYRYNSDVKNKNSISHNQVTQIEESDDHNLWVGTWGGGLNKLIYHDNKDKIRFVSYDSSYGNNAPSSDVIHKLLYDDYGNLWIGTWDGGLMLMDEKAQEESPEDAEFQVYKNDLADPYSISGNNITALFVDRSGMLWVGAASIDRTSILKTGITRYKTSRFNDGNLVVNSVSSVLEDEGKIWVGTNNEVLLYAYSAGNFNLEKNFPLPDYYFKNRRFIANGILSLAKTDKGLWLGTNDAGLVLYPPNTEQGNANPARQYYNTQTSPALPGNKIENLLVSKKYKNVFWLGTSQNGFCKLTFEQENARVETWRQGEANNLSDNNVRTVLEDKSGLVWIGTQNGLNCLDPLSGKLTSYYYSASDTGSINDNVINQLFEDSFGNLWIGTNAGLNKKAKRETAEGDKQVHFEGYPDIEYLDDEIISNILQDDSGNLWLGLYMGLIKFNIANNTVEKEYITKDYQRVVVSQDAGAKIPDGLFVLGGAKGFLSIDPDNLLNNAKKPGIQLTDVFVFNESLSEQDVAKRYGLKKSVPFVETLNLTYKDKIVRFIFSAMDYKYPEKNTYQYYLEGFDKMWNNAGARNSATYTNIKPGEYTFLVKASNSDGIQSSEPLMLNIKVASPWWATLWAFIVYVLLIIGLLYFFKQYSIIQVREKGRIRLENVQFEKEHEVNEVKSRFFTNITHEFRTPLTLIQGPSEELLRMEDLPSYAKKQAGLIQRNAQRLMRLVNQLMEFRTVEQEKMKLFIQNVNATTMLREVYDTFKSMAKSKDLKFGLKIEKDELLVNIDVDKFEKILYNLISNAFKYSEEGDTITISAFKEKTDGDEEFLVVEVEDTGLGIDDQYKEKVFEKFFQANVSQTQSTGGVGLFLSKAFAELHGGKIDLESELGKGSCFRLVLPVDLSSLENAAVLNADVVEDNLENEYDTESMPSSDNKQATILVVEDDREMNDFVVSGLKDEYVVEGAFDGIEGFKMARKTEPDLIISDVMMPEADGFEMMSMLRKDFSTSHIPVVFLTAKTMREDEIMGLKLGAVDYIYKPFNLISLKLKIGNILDNRRKIHDRIRADHILEPEKIELTSLDEKFLKDAVDAVDNNLDDTSFDVEKFSREIGVSPNKVYRKIKALTGQTAKEFIRNQRLKTAANMLIQNRRSISEVIYMVGFSSPSYFTRCFREYYGCTPKEYIEKGGKV